MNLEDMMAGMETLTDADFNMGTMDDSYISEEL